ncbi:hypothetical protein [Dongia deserti]|uniref:hypothetical protein n=1 Tax=Dongia deserti TaxID=2268030 RepID=UPI0013C4146F|nr:hypothetical protein [Dongia deserti]
MEILRYLVLGMSLAIMSAAVNADTVDIQRLTKDQLNKLKPEQIEELPALAVFQKLAEGEKDGEKTLKLIRWMHVQSLRDLYYVDTNPLDISDEELRRGTREFQERIGAKATGELTMSQFKALGQAAAAIHMTTLSFPGVGDEVSIFMNAPLATAEGRMEIEGDKIAFPLNHHKVECWQTMGWCFDYEVSVWTPGGTANPDGSGYFVAPSTSMYQVRSWTNQEIIAEAQGDCRSTTLSLNAHSKEVLFITRNGTGECLLEGMKLSTPRVARLAPSYKFNSDYILSLQKAGMKLYSPRAAKALQEMGFPIE